MIIKIGDKYTVECLDVDESLITYAINEETANNITKWVTDNDLGKRVSYDKWKLKNQLAVEFFLLRWND